MIRLSKLIIFKKKTIIQVLKIPKTGKKNKLPKSPPIQPPIKSLL